MSRPKEANHIYEKERHNIQLTHADFSYDDDFEYLQETEEFTQYLLNKSWDKYFKVQKNNTVICDISIVNKIFENCIKDFSRKMDSVQIFHLITDFYNISANQYFNKLVQGHRMKLINDLEMRLGSMKAAPQTINNKVQLNFYTLFENT